MRHSHRSVSVAFPDRLCHKQPPRTSTAPALGATPGLRPSSRRSFSRYSLSTYSSPSSCRTVFSLLSEPFRLLSRLVLYMSCFTGRGFCWALLLWKTEQYPTGPQQDWESETPPSCFFMTLYGLRAVRHEECLVGHSWISQDTSGAWAESHDSP